MEIMSTLAATSAVDPLHHVLGHTHGRAAQQTAIVILGGVGVLAVLFSMSLMVIRPHSSPSSFTMGSFSMRWARQQLLGLLQRGAHGSGDQVLAGHDLADGAANRLV